MLCPWVIGLGGCPYDSPPNIIPLQWLFCQLRQVLNLLRNSALEQFIQNKIGEIIHFLATVYEKFISLCVTFVRKHRYYLGNNYNKYFIQLESILKSLHILHCLKWRTKDDIVLRVEEAIVKSVREWYSYVANNIICLKSNNRGKINLSTSSSSCSSGSE